VARPERRTFIAKRNGLSSRQRIYRTADAIEVEEVEGYDVTRRRVFFDDIVLVTYHQFLGWTFLVAMGVLLTVSTLLTVLVSLGSRESGLVVFLVFVLPCLIAIILRLVVRVDAVTVYGKRTRAQIPFWFRKQQARELYQQIGRLAREHQERLARQIAAAAPRPLVPPGTVGQGGE
jgi:hypothetical protein